MRTHRIMVLDDQYLQPAKNTNTQASKRTMPQPGENCCGWGLTLDGSRMRTHTSARTKLLAHTLLLVFFFFFYSRNILTRKMEDYCGIITSHTHTLERAKLFSFVLVVSLRVSCSSAIGRGTYRYCVCSPSLHLGSHCAHFTLLPSLCISSCTQVQARREAYP